MAQVSNETDSIQNKVGWHPEMDAKLLGASWSLRGHYVVTARSLRSEWFHEWLKFSNETGKHPE